MKANGNTLARDFDASARKTFHHALCELLHREFPGIFGPAVTELFAREVEALFLRFHPPRDRLCGGQVVWLAVAADERPGWHKRIEDTRLVPVLLDLVTPQDIDHLIDGKSWSDLRRSRLIRLCRQAYDQGGVLSHADLALLLSLSLPTVGKEIQAYEAQTGQSVPRRGTVHDLGMTLTHKAIICHKRFVEKKTTSQVALETFHSPEAVEHYTQSCRRVQMCRDKGMTLDDICQATRLSISLVKQYIELLDLMKITPFHEPQSPHETEHQSTPDPKVT